MLHFRLELAVDKTPPLLKFGPSVGVPEIQEVISSRISHVAETIVKGAVSMGIPESEISKFQVNFLPNELSKLSPFLMLLKRGDFQSGSSTNMQLMAYLNNRHLTDSQLNLMLLCYQFHQQPELAEQEKRFVIYHELAHVLQGDIYSRVNDHDSRLMEKEADLYCCNLLWMREGSHLSV